MSEPNHAPETARTPAFSGPETESSGGEGISLAPPAFQLKASPANVVQRQAPPPPTTIDIQASVGSGGQNRVSDVRAVQTRMVELGLLQARELADLTGKQDTDRMADTDIPGLIRAITYFQRGILNNTDPDGRIDPNGGTEAQLNSNARTTDQIQENTAGMYNHDTLDPISLRIIQNALGGTVDGDMLQDQRTTGAWAMQDETDSQDRVENFQNRPYGYDGQAIAGAPANNDRNGYIEEGTISQVFTNLVGANQHEYALYIVIDYYEDYVDAPGTAAADVRRLSLGSALQVYYDANLTTDFQAYTEMGGMRTIALGPRAFSTAANLRTCLSRAATAQTAAHPTATGAQASTLVNPGNLTDPQRSTVDQTLNATAVASATSFNAGFFNLPGSVNIIQALVGAPITGVFDQATIQRIAYYQTANNLAQPAGSTTGNVGANGQLDPRTVDLMGRDLIARLEYNAAIQFAMDYFNINVTSREGKAFGDPADRTGTMTEMRGDDLTSIRFDPNLTTAFATDASLNATNGNDRIRDVRGIGSARVGPSAFTNFVTLTTTLSQVVSDISRPGQNQLATEGQTRSLITPLADMSTFQVPWTNPGWRTNGSSGWPGATKGGRNGGHGGWDIYAPLGTPIRATTDGVADTGNQSGYGNVVRLYANNRVYFYAHLSGFAIATSGQTTVTQGQVLGYVGVTGNGVPQRPHLHFEIRSGTNTGGATKLDPDDYFTRPTKQRFYSTKHQDMITTEIPNDTEFPYPGVAQTPQAPNNTREDE